MQGSCKVNEIGTARGTRISAEVTPFLRQSRGQISRTEAHDLLAPIYGWFTEGFDTPVLK